VVITEYCIFVSYKNGKTMRTLSEIFDSVVKSYNKKELLNFTDLRDLDELLKNSDLVKSFIYTYNNKEQINFIQIRDLENLL